MTIGQMTVEQITEGVQVLLSDNLPDLQQAYATSDEPFSISLTAKIKPVAEGNRIDIRLKFVTGQVNETVVRIVNEDQVSFIESVKDGSLEVSVGW